MILAFLGFVLFMIGTMGLLIYLVMKAFAMGVVMGLWSLALVGVIAMVLGAMIESELNS